MLPLDDSVEACVSTAERIQAGMAELKQASEECADMERGGDRRGSHHQAANSLVSTPRCPWGMMDEGSRFNRRI
jgi:hypothetical protein